MERVGVCNLALGWLGAKLITSLDDGSTAANLCKANWDALRDTALEARAWTFATRRAQLAPAAGAPAWGYSTRYLLDTSVLRLLEAKTIEDQPLVYEREERYVLTDEAGGIRVRFIFRQDDTTTWSPAFSLALAHLIASKLAGPLTENESNGAAHFKLYLAQLGDAGVLDGKQGSLEIPRFHSDLQRARY